MYELPLSPGEIVTAHVLDAQGRNPKWRPCVVISGGEDEEDDGPIFVVVITGTLADVAPEDRVGLPFQNSSRHPKTGLDKASAAHCGWHAHITRHHIRESRGRTPDAEMQRILQRLTELGLKG